MDTEKLVHMANQIAKFFAASGDAAAAEGVKDHLAKFWEPRMRAEIIAHAESGGAGLEPAAAKGVALLAQDQP